jgi:hypothetical protein
MIKGLVRYAIALSEAMAARALRTLRIFSRIKYYSYRTYALTKFSKYVGYILSLVGCVRPDKFAKNRFLLSDAP